MSSAPSYLPILTTLFFGLILLAPASLWAQSEEPPRRIAFSEDLRIFLGPDVGIDSEELHSLQQSLSTTALREWRSQDLPLEVIPPSALQDALISRALYEQTLSLARQWGEMGVNAYKEVQSQNAVEYLERALQNFSTISHELVAPQELAEILMFLALSYLEDGTDVVRPLEILQEMIRRDPTLKLQPGYYPDFIVRYYQSARDTLWRELRQDGPPLEETRRIAEILDADFVFHAYAIAPSPDSVEVIAYLYNRELDQLLPPEEITLSELTSETLAEAISRLTSRLAACLLAPPSLPDSSDLNPSQGTGRLAIQLTLNYGSFLQMPAPLRSPFGNYGVGIGTGWSITREFQLIAGIQIFNSLRDYDGILREDFTTLRAHLGGQLGRRFGPLHLAMAAGLETASFSPIRVFTDPACIPAPEILCPGDSGTLIYSNRGLHWGVLLRPRLALPLADSFELSSSISLGYYFSPLDDRLLNFPLTTEFGIHYRF